MGEVYRATDRLLRRSVAIKLIRPEVVLAAADDDLFLTLRRFRREAKVAATLRSPHAVHIYDFGLAGGTFYIAMELLQGLNLEELVQRFGPVPPERAVHFLRQACVALEEMHVAGIAHRDVKPANLHACCVGGHHDIIKLTDLGMVRPPQGTTAEHVALRARGEVLGTPAYIAPETALGEPGDVRSDIYGLGCVGYWLLTGRLVFEAKRVRDIVAQHVHQPPAAPSEHTELPLPPALDNVVLDCLQKEPERRPASVRELLHRFDDCPAPQPWTRERARRWWETHAPDGLLVAAAGG
jgi:serine/threonine-protein kinase